eukprot:scaffold123418_cov18-Tisochrysis_lutea.AAC.1
MVQYLCYGLITSKNAEVTAYTISTCLRYQWLCLCAASRIDPQECTERMHAMCESGSTAAGCEARPQCHLRCGLEAPPELWCHPTPAHWQVEGSMHMPGVLVDDCVCPALNSKYGLDPYNLTGCCGLRNTLSLRGSALNGV